MAVTSKVYGLAQQSLANKEIDFDSDTLKVMLCSAAYQPDQDTHRYRSQVTGEVAGSGYTPGGTVLTGRAVSYDAATNTTRLTCGNVSWLNSSITAHYAVFYIDTGNPATSPLLCYWDFGGDFVSNNGPFDLTINPAGLVTLQAA